jgi:hypothetical protein
MTEGQERLTLSLLLRVENDLNDLASPTTIFSKGKFLPAYLLNL